MLAASRVVELSTLTVLLKAKEVEALVQWSGCVCMVSYCSVWRANLLSSPSIHI